MRDAEVVSSGIMTDGRPQGEVTELERVKAKLADSMAEEQKAQAKHAKLVLAELELTAQVSESQAQLELIAAKKQALQTQAMELARKNGKARK